MGPSSSSTFQPRLALALALSLLPTLYSVATPPPLIVFGDYFGDVGTNNFVPGSPHNNHRPYGRMYAPSGNYPTGRATDGSIFADAMAQYLGLRYPLRAYLDATAQGENRTQGISFASGGAGILDATSTFTGGIPLPTQLEQFRAYKRKVNLTTEDAVFQVALGQSDFFRFRYNSSSLLSPNAFVETMIQNLGAFLAALIAEGARTIAVANVVPVSKLPAYVSSFPGHANQTAIDSVEANYAARVKTLIHSLTAAGSDDLTLIELDFYGHLNAITASPGSYGFNKATIGIACCGLDGKHSAATCNVTTPICPISEGNSYLYFDRYHLSQHGSLALFRKLKTTLSLHI